MATLVKNHMSHQQHEYTLYEHADMRSSGLAFGEGPFCHAVTYALQPHYAGWKMAIAASAFIILQLFGKDLF